MQCKHPQGYSPSCAWCLSPCESERPQRTTSSLCPPSGTHVYALAHTHTHTHTHTNARTYKHVYCSESVCDDEVVCKANDMSIARLRLSEKFTCACSVQCAGPKTDPFDRSGVGTPSNSNNLSHTSLFLCSSFCFLTEVELAALTKLCPFSQGHLSFTWNGQLLHRMDVYEST